MLKKVSGILICVLAAILMIIGILGLIKAFDAFSNSEITSEGMGYAFGSIVMPLLFVVLGRWIWRKGINYSKQKQE